MKTKDEIQRILEEYYNGHHDKEMFETALINALDAARVSGFIETKRQVVAALDFRIGNLEKKKEVILNSRRDPTIGAQLNDAEDEGRQDELETFRQYVKGMAVKANKDE